MLRFNEAERPSFIELTKLVLTSTDNTLDGNQGGNVPIKSINPVAVASMVSSKSRLINNSQNILN